MSRSKKNQSTISKKKILILSIVLGLFVLVVIYNSYKNHELLKNDSFVTLTKIEHLIRSARKGTTSNEDVVYFCFQYNNIVFHRIESLPEGAIKSYGIEVGDIFPIRVVKSNFGISEIEFLQKKDTVLNFDSDLPHKYQSESHKRIIRMKPSHL